MAALYLLENSNAGSSQRLPINASAAPIDTILFSRLSMNYSLKTVKYETVATVLRQRDDRLPGRASLVSAVSKVARLTVRNILSNRCRNE